jgi:hypothetical protein
MTELEKTVTLWRSKGLAWCEAKLRSDLLDKDKDSFLASLVNDLRKADPEASEKRLETDAKASSQYRDFIRGAVLAKHAELVAKVEYDALDKLFSARQSDQSLLKEQIARNIYHEGGK